METTSTASLKHVRLPQDDTLGRLKGLKALVVFASIITTLTAGYQATLTPVTLVVNGQVQRLRTHQGTVDGTDVVR